MRLEDEKEMQASCCSAHNRPNAYCFDAKCRRFACENCVSRHSEHRCMALSELSLSIKTLAEEELPRLKKVIEHERKHIEFLKEGEEDVRKGINDQKSAVVNILWEMYRLVNSCLSDEIQSQLFSLKQLKERRKEMEGVEGRHLDHEKVLAAAIQNAGGLENTADNIEIYKRMLDMRISEEEEKKARNEASEALKRNSKYKYDYLNNKFMGLMNVFIQDLKKQKGGLEELDDKFKRPDLMNKVKPKNVKLDYKAKLAPHISSFVYYLKEGGNEVNIYNMKAEKGIKLFVDKNKFLKHCDSVQIDTKIYYSGGGVYEKITFEYDYVLNGNTSERKCDMNFGKNLHKLLAISKYKIVSIGGQGPDGALDICELFDIAENIWKLMPCLNEKKYGIAPCCFQSHLIYVFGGFTVDDGIEKFLNTIELLNYKEPQGNWKVINIKGKGIRGRIDMSAISISKEQVLIFGGYDGDFKANAFLFTPETTSIAETGQMVEGESFNARKPIWFKEKVYVVGYRSKHVHVYDARTTKWDLVKADSWLPKVVVEEIVE
eukprot:TRINITY_DN1415_c0_g2_i4.p1 TRINITY_DN1415_c0_g2~~TRINITY_DN1415_c0_g2_i4.p1  ORF type:complete len:565 (+),score=146.74 TRINITY_DN1415_c0_g2_i4:58-1695(+)